MKLVIANKNYSSWSLRPWLLMKRLGIAFDEQSVFFVGTDEWDRFRRFAPNGRVPCLIDGETAVWDSLGITLYLADRHDGVWPAAADAKAFAQCAVAEMHSGFAALRGGCPMSVGIRATLRDVSPALARDIARVGELFGEGLDRFGGPWLAGERFTAIDAFFAPVAFRARSFGLDLGPRGNDWVAHMLALPEMREWEAAALAEVERDEPHEAEIAGLAEITEDHRAGAGA